MIPLILVGIYSYILNCFNEVNCMYLLIFLQLPFVLELVLYLSNVPMLESFIATTIFLFTTFFPCLRQCINMLLSCGRTTFSRCTFEIIILLFHHIYILNKWVRELKPVFFTIIPHSFNIVHHFLTSKKVNLSSISDIFNSLLYILHESLIFSYNYL